MGYKVAVNNSNGGISNLRLIIVVDQAYIDKGKYLIDKHSKHKEALWKGSFDIEYRRGSSELVMHIKDKFIVPYQRVSSGYCVASALEMRATRKEDGRDIVTNLGVWSHSHHTMDVFSSNVDDDMAITNSLNSDVYINHRTNAAGKHRFDVGFRTLVDAGGKKIPYIRIFHEVEFIVKHRGNAMTEADANYIDKALSERIKDFVY